MKPTPEARTMEPEEAHPLYLRWLAWRGSGMQLAAALARAGHRDAALAIRDGVDTAIRGAHEKIPRTREEESP